MRSILFSIILLFTYNQSFAQSSNSTPLKFLSWNTYMLPGFPMFTHQKKRAKGMVEVLNVGEYDIICFQEAYHKGFRRIILKGLKEKYPYQLDSRDIKKPFKASSGLWVLSKKPIHTIKAIEFVDRKGLEKHAGKGAILFKQEGLNDFHFIVTHMQSADGEEETAVRKGQSQQIYKELVEPYSNQNKTILFAGDWNMEPGSDFDNLSLRVLFNISLPESMPTENTWPSTSFSKSPERYLFDLIMLFDPSDRIFDFKTSIPNLNVEWKKGRADLSDHLPVDARFLYKYK